MASVSVTEMRSAPFVLLGLLAALVAGCGGGGGDKRLTHAELVSQGNAICVKASGDIDKLGDPASLADIARIGAQLATIREAETAELGALKVAKDDEDGQTRLIDALTARDKTLREVVSAARKNDQAAATKALAAGQPLGDKASNAALDLGLLRCAEGG
jgi:hypothetical protein